MSGIWGWFGGSAAQKKDSPKNAILGLRSQLDMLQKRERHLQNLMTEQENIARQYVNSNKNLAKAALKRKKQHEHSLEQTQGQIVALEQQINAIESANINMETLEAMKRASKAMSAIHGKLTPEKVDETMATLAEQNQFSEEIAEAMTSVNVGNQIDEQDLEDELEAMQQEELEGRMLSTGTVPVADKIQQLPNAAEGPIKSGKAPVEEDEEEELRKLQAEMAM
ncbi:hypothetical protein VTK73DRAFT_5977 [Phialemonium thermophilum]|uniref:Vacuolar-sorting protein SNF7 n=1 Tax=Phialemonium thermophilum TaxID=223376 RepID=A0ABR3WKX8_9PEZI